MELCCSTGRQAALADDSCNLLYFFSSRALSHACDCIPLSCCSDMLGRPRTGVRVEATGEAEMRMEERPPHASGSAAPVEGRYVDARSGPSRGEANAAVQVREGARSLK